MRRASPLSFWRWLTCSLSSILVACTPAQTPEAPTANQATPMPLMRQHPATLARAHAADPFTLIALGMQAASAPPTETVPLALPESINDDVLRHRIAHDLQHDSELSRFDIGVELHDGVVTLSGVLPDAATKTRAETLSKLHLGVKALNSLLNVAAPPAARHEPASSASDNGSQTLPTAP